MLFRRPNSRDSLLVIAVVFLFLSACGGRGATPDEQPEVVEKPLVKHYNHIVVLDFETAPEVQRDYPTAAKECQSNVVSALLMKNLFDSVGTTLKDEKKGNTLVVKATVKEMRIVSTAARIWLGAMVGSSYMNIDVQLLDAATNRVLREKAVNSTNSAFAAAWSSGSSDRSMPSDMGKIIAKYIESVVPPK